MGTDDHLEAHHSAGLCPVSDESAHAGAGAGAACHPARGSMTQPQSVATDPPNDPERPVRQSPHAPTPDLPRSPQIARDRGRVEPAATTPGTGCLGTPKDT